MVAFLLLSFGCIVTVNILWLLLTVLWVGLQFVIVVFPGHTHFLKFSCLKFMYLTFKPYDGYDLIYICCNGRSVPSLKQYT